MGLFEADLLAGVAQVILVIQVHAGDDGAVGVNDVDGVQPPAQPDLQDDRIQGRLREQAHDGQRGELEIGQTDIAARGLDRLELGDQVGVRGNLAVDPRPLVEIDQVRRGVQTHPVARRLQNRFQHGTGGALAVGAADHEGHGVEFERKALSHCLDTIQAHVDGLGMQGFQVLQPIGQGGRGIGARKHGDD